MKYKIKEISEEHYWSVYGGVPPIGLHPVWMCSEAYDWDEEGYDVYMMYFEFKGRFYEGPCLRRNADLRKVLREIIRDYNL